MQTDTPRADTPQPGEREGSTVGCGLTGATLREIQSACMYYRHDFGLLSPSARAGVRADALQWLYAWQKAFGLDTPITALTRERDEAVRALRAIGEETASAGLAAGDRDTTIANVRTLTRELAEARAEVERRTQALLLLARDTLTGPCWCAPIGGKAACEHIRAELEPAPDA